MIYIFIFLLIVAVAGLTLAIVHTEIINRLLKRNLPRKTIIAPFAVLVVAFLIGIFACLNDRLEDQSPELKSTTTTILTRETTTTKRR